MWHISYGLNALDKILPLRDATNNEIGILSLSNDQQTINGSRFTNGRVGGREMRPDALSAICWKKGMVQGKKSQSMISCIPSRQTILSVRVKRGRQPTREQLPVLLCARPQPTCVLLLFVFGRTTDRCNKLQLRQKQCEFRAGVTTCPRMRYIMLGRRPLFLLGRRRSCLLANIDRSFIH